MGSKPLQGKRLGLVTETLGEGVAPEVNEAVRKAAAHLESLGAVVEEVRGPWGGGGFKLAVAASAYALDGREAGKWYQR